MDEPIRKLSRIEPPAALDRLVLERAKQRLAVPRKRSARTAKLPIVEQFGYATSLGVYSLYAVQFTLRWLLHLLAG
jgi:hypothetical protein